MVHDLSTSFIGRLRARDHDAWYELWVTFGPILRAQLMRWGRGRIGVETVQDLSQETMAALERAIDRHDPSQGARFSTWLLAIARYTLGDEIDRRMAHKRGGGKRALSLDESYGGASDELAPDDIYEQAVFDAKVEAALRRVEREAGFLQFSIFRKRVLEGKSGKQVALLLGTSEPTVSRRLAEVRALLRRQLSEVFSKYSFTQEELEEAARKGLEVNPNKQDDARFDEAVAEVYHRICQRQGGPSRA